MEEIYLVFYVTSNGDTFNEKCFKSLKKTLDYCEEQQAISNDLKKDKSYLYKKLELID